MCSLLYHLPLFYKTPQLNASDDRGIGIVRGPIQAFASTKVLFTRKAYKLIILDEADAMTHDAQNALRRSTCWFRFLSLCVSQYSLIPLLSVYFFPLTHGSHREVHHERPLLLHLQLHQQDHPGDSVALHQVSLRPAEVDAD